MRVPATSANLGPGFDALGLALDVWDEVTATALAPGSETEVKVHGEGADTLARDETHLVLRALRAAFAHFGVEPAPVGLECRNSIPHRRGLGSSAAAICAGVLLAAGLGGVARDDAVLVALASRLEGHPDNVSACLLGGLAVSWTGADGAAAIRLDAAGFVPVVLVPAETSSTEQARGLLPAQVPHGDAAFNAARAALLVAALTGRPDVLWHATEDKLHQPYRSAAMPTSAALMERLRGDAIPAVISGAGPSVLALAVDDAQVRRVTSACPPGWHSIVSAVPSLGAQLS